MAWSLPRTLQRIASGPSTGSPTEGRLKSVSKCSASLQRSTCNAVALWYRGAYSDTLNA